MEAVNGEGGVGGPFGEGGGESVAGNVEEGGEDVMLELHGELHGGADVAGDHGSLEVDDGGLHEVACADEGGDDLEATRDARVGAVFFAYNRRLYDVLAARPLPAGSWGQVRWQEMLTACQWLLDNFGSRASQADLAATWSLMDLLTVQGFNWTCEKMFH